MRRIIHHQDISSIFLQRLSAFRGISIYGSLYVSISSFILRRCVLVLLKGFIEGAPFEDLPAWLEKKCLWTFGVAVWKTFFHSCSGLWLCRVGWKPLIFRG